MGAVSLTLVPHGLRSGKVSARSRRQRYKCSECSEETSIQNLAVVRGDGGKRKIVCVLKCLTGVSPSTEEEIQNALIDSGG